jgi:hypothetical protein
MSQDKPGNAMAKLSISRDDWLNAAAHGDLSALESWHRSGALDIRYEPIRLGMENKPQGRARIFDVTSQSKENALHRAIGTGQVEYALRLLDLGRFAATANNEGDTPYIWPPASAAPN